MKVVLVTLLALLAVSKAHLVQVPESIVLTPKVVEAPEPIALSPKVADAPEPIALSPKVADAPELNALPSQVEPETLVAETRNTRFIGGIIVGVIEDVMEQIRDAGLDPFHHEGAEATIGLPVPVLFNTDLRVKNFGLTGLSNIIIHDMDFGLLNTRLRLDVSLPEIALSLDDLFASVTILGTNIHGEGFGRVAIIQPRVAGSIRFNIGIISGITVQEIDLRFTLGGINFNGYVNVMGHNVTPEVVDFLTRQIPQRLTELRAEINELVEIIVRQVVESILN